MPFPALAGLGAVAAKALPFVGAAGAGFLGQKLAGGKFKDPGSQVGQELRFQRFAPNQQKGLDFALQNALSGLGKNNFDFGPIAQQARTNFYQQTVPGIAERFTSLGSGGSQHSSAFAQQLGAAGAGLEGDLAAMQQDYGLQQQQMLMNLLGIGLTPQFESAYQPRQPGILESLAKGGAQTLPMLGLLKYQHYLKNLPKAKIG